MGGIFARLKRGKKSSKEVLEGIESEIKKLSQRASLNSHHEKSFVCYLLALSFVIYLIAAVVFYCYFIPTTWVDGINVAPLVLFPAVIYGVKRLLGMYFAHRQQKYATRLKALNEEKKKVLDTIMENEVYKVAVELLERFDPNNPALKKVQEPKREDVRQRRPKKDNDPQRPHPAYLVPHGTPQLPPNLAAMHTPRLRPPFPPPVPFPQTAAGPPEAYIPPGMCLGPAPGPPQPSPILPRDRSKLDKMVDYLVGDGPSNRYALICSKCCSHNGMALKDDFEYTAFRCAYCYELNQARKKKPLQPPPSSSVDHTPAPSTPTTPLKASKHEADHTPKVDVADHTPKEDVTEHVPKQDVTDHTPKQDVTDHTPEENANQTGSTGSERNELEPNAS